METVICPVAMIFTTVQLVFVLFLVNLGVFADDLYQPDLQTSTYFPRRIYKDGDLVIGIIIPVSASEDCCNGTTPCTLVPESILWTEALMFAIRSINQNELLLRNITLGFDIRDSCDSGHIAMSHALDFLDVVEASRCNKLINCSAACHEQPEHGLSSAPYNFSQTLTEINISRKKYTSQRVVFKTGSIAENVDEEKVEEMPLEMSDNSTSKKNYQQVCSQKPVVAIIGCLTSDDASAVASTLQAAMVPMVGFAPTTVSLGDQTRYPSFIRTVLGDSIRAKAMVEILSKYGWSYISIIGTVNKYGRQGVESLLEEVTSREMCVAVSEYFQPDSPTIDADIQKIVATIVNNPKATVVVLYMDWRHVKLILKEADKQNVSGIIWMTTEAWGEHPSLADFRRSLVEGAIGLALPRPKSEEFHEYLRSIDVVCSTNHPWLYQLVCSKGNCDPEVIQYHHECCLRYFRRNKKMTCPLPSALNIANIMKEYIYYIDADTTFNAVHTIAHGLDAFLKNSTSFQEELQSKDSSNLDQTPLDLLENATSIVNSNSPELLQPTEFRYSDLMKYMKNVEFVSFSGKKVSYSKNGNMVEGYYNVVNLQYNDCTDRLEWKVVGGVHKTDGQIKVHVNKEKVRFAAGKTTAVSRCSALCKPGSKMLRSPQECCWECQACPEGTVSNRSMASDCYACGIIEHTDPNNTVCLPDKLKWLFLDGPVGIVILVASILGQVITLTVISILGRHKNNPICAALSFKTTSLLVCFAGFLQPMIYTVQPTDILCTFQKLTFCSVYIVHGATLVARTHKVKFLVDKLKRKFGNEIHNIHHGVMWMFAIVGFVFLGLSFLRNVPFVRYKKESAVEVFVICVETMAVEEIVAMGYPMLLLIITGLLAETSKNGPSLDDKFLSYTSGAMLLMLVIFLPIYYTIDDGIGKVIILTVSVIITQYAVLFLTYFTKIYYMFRSYHKKESVRTALALRRQNMAALGESYRTTNGSVISDRATES